MSNQQSQTVCLSQSPSTPACRLQNSWQTEGSRGSLQLKVTTVGADRVGAGLRHDSDRVTFVFETRGPVPQSPLLLEDPAVLGSFSIQVVFALNTQPKPGKHFSQLLSECLSWFLSLDVRIDIHPRRACSPPYRSGTWTKPVVCLWAPLLAVCFLANGHHLAAPLHPLLPCRCQTAPRLPGLAPSMSTLSTSHSSKCHRVLSVSERPSPALETGPSSCLLHIPGTSDGHPHAHAHVSLPRSPDPHAPPCVGKLHPSAPVLGPKSWLCSPPAGAGSRARSLSPGPCCPSLLPQPVRSPGAKADPSEVQVETERGSELLGASFSRGISLCPPELVPPFQVPHLLKPAGHSPSSASLRLSSLPQMAPGSLPSVPSYQAVICGGIFREPPL